jgi:hypothetical protein
MRRDSAGSQSTRCDKGFPRRICGHGVLCVHLPKAKAEKTSPVQIKVE